MRFLILKRDTLHHSLAGMSADQPEGEHDLDEIDGITILSKSEDNIEQLLHTPPFRSRGISTTSCR